jgi:hypothetical protein
MHVKLVASRNALQNIHVLHDIQKGNDVGDTAVFHGHSPAIGVTVRLTVFGRGRTIPQSNHDLRISDYSVMIFSHG